MMQWTGFIWCQIGINGGLYWERYWFFELRDLRFYSAADSSRFLKRNVMLSGLTLEISVILGHDAASLGNFSLRFEATTLSRNFGYKLTSDAAVVSVDRMLSQLLLPRKSKIYHIFPLLGLFVWPWDKWQQYPLQRQYLS
jgi:hypothetical protein